MNCFKKTTLSMMCIILLNGCATSTQNSKYKVSPSFLENKLTISTATDGTVTQAKAKKTVEVTPERYESVPSMQHQVSSNNNTPDLLDNFSDTKEVSLTADKLELKSLLHLVLGDLLKVSYVLDEQLNTDTQTVTLNLQSTVSEKKLFTLTSELLAQRGYIIRLEDKIYYVHKDTEQSAKSEIVYGYGKNVADVPNTSAEIVQMVPFEYGMQISLANTIRQLLGVKINPDTDRSALIIQGKRAEIIRALEFVQLMDRPAMLNRQIGLFKATYLSTGDLINKLEELLKQEGLDLGKQGNFKTAISVVELNQQGTLVFFANSMSVIDRAVFWAQKIDKPIMTLEKQYFIYVPQYSRATDLGTSLEALITDGSSSISNQTSLSNENNSASKATNTARSASSERMKMVVDERANSLIFYTTGEEYQKLLPLVKRLDIQPKQVMLEVLIAEVSLTDEFKLGVEYAFNNGNYGLSTTGAFMGDGFGGLSYLLKGQNGQLAMNMLQTNSLVNILSRPTLVVRDGVSASINVGTDIPIIGETASDPINGDRQTTKIEYRKTGVELKVTPTVNAQGVIVMDIDQKISNQVQSGSTVAGNPSVFERTIKTEVIAKSAQTIVLGGLISENRSDKESSVPLFGSIPIIGNLFKAQTSGGDKTELVIFVTPRVIESADEWQALLEMFKSNLTELTIH